MRLCALLASSNVASLIITQIKLTHTYTLTCSLIRCHMSKSKRAHNSKSQRRKFHSHNVRRRKLSIQADGVRIRKGRAAARAWETETSEKANRIKNLSNVIRFKSIYYIFRQLIDFYDTFSDGARAMNGVLRLPLQIRFSSFISFYIFIDPFAFATYLTMSATQFQRFCGSRPFGMKMHESFSISRNQIKLHLMRTMRWFKRKLQVKSEFLLNSIGIATIRQTL